MKERGGGGEGVGRGGDKGRVSSHDQNTCKTKED